MTRRRPDREPFTSAFAVRPIGCGQKLAPLSFRFCRLRLGKHILRPVYAKSESFADLWIPLAAR